MAESAITDNTDWIVTPETTVDDPVNENILADNKYIEMIRNITEKHPSVSVVTGMASYTTGSSQSETEGDNIVRKPSFS